MIAVGSQNEESRHHSSLSSISTSTNIGDELPSLSCDLGDLDITTNEFEQLLETFGESPHTPHMPLGMSAASFALSQCDFTSLFLEDTPRPRDLNLSFPGESNVSPLFDTGVPSSSPSATSSSSFTAPVGRSNSDGDSTPTNTPTSTILQSLSRPSSPAWSESSGSISSSTAAPPVSAGRTRHLSSEGASIPRHKRPSHKRAEIKRRDKIKTCLDDIKSQIPSICEKGKLSESAILTKVHSKKISQQLG